ncbi:MAG: HD family hydrolase [Anaerolineae bacterium]|nr:HD family hydrolase [Anaerolineae bacterium]
MDHGKPIEPGALVDVLVEVETLKRMQRTGWAMRGVSYVESIADHIFGTVFVALVLADALNEDGHDLDMEQVLLMALLHDLAEVRLTDLPASATRLIPAEVKSRAEAEAMAGLLAPLPGARRLLALWQAFEDRDSPEGRLVRDADKLEMMAQCLRYELAGSCGLDEFWQSIDALEWHYPLSAGLYRRLREMRPG